MKRLLLVHHTVSPALETLFEAVRAGASDPSIEGVEVVARPALAATPTDVLESDGYVLGTPANLGYMSGALKHFFDVVYYPCRGATGRRPYGVYVHGNNDTDGALAAIERIVRGLEWREVHAPVAVVGEVDASATEAGWDLDATVAASLTLD